MFAGYARKFVKGGRNVEVLHDKVIVIVKMIFHDINDRGSELKDNDNEFKEGEKRG